MATVADKTNTTVHGDFLPRSTVVAGAAAPMRPSGDRSSASLLDTAL
jgi:hypothetical protein